MRVSTDMCEAYCLASSAPPPPTSCSSYAGFAAGFDLVAPKSHDVSIANWRRNEPDRIRRFLCLPAHPPTMPDEAATVETLDDDPTE